MFLRKLAVSVLAFFALLTPLRAEPLAKAHPALWHVKGSDGEIYLLGSIHLLPQGLDWRRENIDAAIRKAEVFVFETSTDEKAQDRIRALVTEMGMLPPGRSLRTMLPPDARADYDAAIADAHIPPAVADRERPWLVSLQLLVAQGVARHYSADSGVDRAVMEIAARRHKPMRFFETIEQQLRLLAGDSEDLQIQEFATDLKEYRKDADDLAPMLDAWSKGEAGKLASLMNKELAGHPEAKKALITDRNQRWALQIETMLREKRVFFITVGAGHLAGPEGVPALLRKAGYRVDGP